MNQKQKIVELLGEAQQLVDRREYNQALIIYNQIIGIDQNNILAHNNKGMILFHNQDLIGAIEEFDISIQNYDKSARLYKATVYNYMNKNNYALFQLNELLKMDPINIDALIYKGQIYRELNQHQEAIDCYNKIKEIDITNLDAEEGLTQIYLDQSNYIKAHEALDNIISYHPQNVEAHLRKAYCFMQNKQYVESKEYLDKAEKIEPNNSNIYLNKGILLQQQELFAESINQFEQALTYDQLNCETYNYLGVSYINLKLFDEALQCYKKIISIDPEDSHAYNNLGVLYKDLQQYDLAIINFKKASNLSSNNPLYKINWAILLLDTDKDKALQLLQEAKESFDTNWTQFNYKGETLEFIRSQFLILELQQHNSEIYSQRDQITETQPIVEEPKQILQSKAQIYMSQSAQNSQMDISNQSKKIRQSGRMMSMIESLRKEFHRYANRMEVMEDKFKTIGLDEKYKILHQLEEFRNTIEGTKQLAYFQSFYWTLFNYFTAYHQMSTRIAQPNLEQTLETTKEKRVQQTQQALYYTTKLTSGLPGISSVMDLIHSGIQATFDVYKMNKHKDRVELISQIVQQKGYLQDQLEIQIALAALELSIKKKNEIIASPSSPIKTKTNQTFSQYIQKVINRMVNEEQSSVYLGLAGKIGLEDAYHCLGYFYHYGLMDLDVSLSQEIVNIIILEKFNEILYKFKTIPVEQVQENRCGNCCAGICKIY